MNEVEAWVIGSDHPLPYADMPGYIVSHRLHYYGNVVVYELGEWSVMSRADFDKDFEWV